MPVTYLNVTDIAHDDQRMEDQLLREVSCTFICGPAESDTQQTGRKVVLDPDWRTPTAPRERHGTFLYDSEIEYILIKTDCKVVFHRIVPIDTEAVSACMRWNNRSGEQYYIFKVDPAQQVVIVGSPTVRFFRCANKEEKASTTEEPQPKPHAWRPKRLVRPWEAEDVYQQRGVVANKISPPEHLAEAARRFKAWRAMTTKRLFVYLMVPKQLHEAEWVQLLGGGLQFFDDVPWVL